MDHITGGIGGAVAVPKLDDVDKDVLPRTDNQHVVGTSTKRWRDGRFVNLYVGDPQTSVGETLTTVQQSVADNETIITSLEADVAAIENVIDDSLTTSATKTWSIDRILAEINSRHPITPVTLYLSSFGGTYASEKWMSVTTGTDNTGDVVWAQGNGTLGDGAGLVTDEQIQVTPGVTYYVNAWDKYDDSWDGTLYALRTAPNGGGTLVINNNGLTPDDGEDTDMAGWTPGDDLETSEMFVYTQ